MMAMSQILAQQGCGTHILVGRRHQFTPPRETRRPTLRTFRKAPRMLCLSLNHIPISKTSYCTYDQWALFSCVPLFSSSLVRELMESVDLRETDSQTNRRQ